MEILVAVGGVFRDFTYHRELVSELTWVLEFEATVINTTSDDAEEQGKAHRCSGVDIIEWSAPCWQPDARIVRFDVMVRPLPVLAILKNEMVKALMG